ncbi:hypothetical protein HIM_03930 [Hirsutella minnesotensis 3608]|uniref:Lipocalin-like domain-containing protein n=1 Tax=Hirsutella minnesotensis 3608 TaxID=1043627 RepID=A0A0F8A676_9HYPO|nr:hypothetical protein HIM_03930 [Hirsutella minnesotensis 3608]
MAAPANKTIKDLNGKWVLNKKLSDSPDEGLALQGIGFLLRKTIGLATITITVKEYEGPPKPPSTADGTFTHIDFEQSASGLSSTKEERCLDNQPRSHSDWLFGDVEGRSRFVRLADVDDAFLSKGWDGAADQDFVHSRGVNEKNGWEATQVWGFQTVNGERRFCRNILITKGDKRAEFRFVYDFSE